MEDAIEQSGGASTGGSSQPKLAAKQIVIKHLDKLCKQLFTSLDDSLFEYANRAGNNQQQEQYFSAMRDMRKDQKKILLDFFANFDALYEDAIQGISFNDSSDNSSSQNFSHTTLSLVDEDEEEESLAITNMIEKCLGMCRDDLLAISQRFSHIIDGLEFKSETCPPSPHNICHAFEQAIGKTSMNLNVKLIVYKLFDKFVVTQLGTVYHDINVMFINSGVLPTIKLKSPVKSPDQKSPSIHEELPKSSSAPNPKKEQKAETSAIKENDEVSFDSLKQLLSKSRGEPVDGDTASVGTGGSGGGEVSYVTVDVLAGLTDLQGDFLGEAAKDMQHASVEEIKNSLISTLSKRSGDESGKRIDSDESDVIDIVSMMFEFILEDKSLSDRVRAEIARLQIPIIKVAIMEKEFFNIQDHPARLLLNELAFAGGSTAEGDDDVIFKKIEYVVNRVLTEFQTNVDIFTELLDEFKQFIDKELQPNKVSEKRLQQTKQKVSDEMEVRIKKYKIPKLIYEFLIVRWKDVLTAVGMRSGCTGQSWSACLDVVDDLIWSVQPKLMASERQELTRSIPRLIKRLREGLKFISTDQNVVNTFLDQLGTLHLKCLKGGDELVKKKEPLDDLDKMIAEMDEATSVVDSGNPFAADLPAGDFEYFSGSDDFTMIKLTPEVKRSKQYPVVRDMAIGTWVEFIDEKKNRRGKLTWKCDFTGDYTFVDRRYKVVADIATSDLVMRLEKKTALIVTDVPLLDRAIDAVISTMTKCLQGANKLVSSTS